MNLLYALLSTIVFLACTNHAQNIPTDASMKEASSSSNDDAIKNVSHADRWQESFTQFIDALVKLDKEKMKSFIDFPINNEGNEIWYWVNPELLMSIDADKIKPFTEKDFDQYYSQVFSYDLRKVMEGLDLRTFFEKYICEAPEIVLLKDTKTKLKALYQEEAKKIVLTLTTEFTGEHPYFVANEFHFDVLKTGHIKFRQMKMQDSE